jgi:putative oxygen-independent coproporphyrinogen III oxidase
MTHLAFYIHWPFCLSKCPYCDFNSHVRETVDAKRWQQALLDELEYVAHTLPGRQLASIFFGGGTPSLMPPEMTAALIARAQALWPPLPGVEITLEANPTSVEAGRFAAFRQAGINRVSLGVQSFDDRELQFLGRGHSAREAMNAIALSQQHFPRASFDLIYARPNQTVEGWRQELAQALSFGTEHLSLYQLTIEPNTAFAHAYAKGRLTLPDDDTSEALYRLTAEVAQAQGLFAYEVSNYARPGSESRHNLAYWQGREYAGIGPGAHGRIVPVGGQRTATATLKSPERWLEAVERHGHGFEQWEALDAQTDLEERFMMGLRLAEGVAHKDFAPVLSEAKLALYTREGLLEPMAGRVVTTLRGRLVLTRLTGELLS